MKVLILEDEPELNKLASEYLRQIGHEVWSAFNLEDAADILEQLEFAVDLIIADKRLPDGESTEFILEVREKLPNAKIAMVSGYLTGDEREILEKENIRCYDKPLLYSKVVKDATDAPPHLVAREASAPSKMPMKIRRTWRPYVKSKK